MDIDNALDHQIATEIERLREEFTDTQELYREVCVLLFFRHGITPTANKLYQLVHKGSMSAPAEALRIFWEVLREKSRVRIEHPDLPETLRAAAGEMVATLWTQAQEAAEQNLMVLRDQAVESIRLAHEAQQFAETEKLGFQKELERLRQELQTVEKRALQLERDFSSEKASNEALSGQLISAGQQHKALESALDGARREFASELEKQRQALERSEERLEGSEKRALLEIDHERQSASRLHLEIQQLRQSHQDTIERHLSAMADLQRKAGELTQTLGVAEGKIQLQKETLMAMTAQLESMREQLSKKETQVALFEREMELREKRIDGLEVELAAKSKSDQKPLVKPQTRRKKNSFF